MPTFEELMEAKKKALEARKVQQAEETAKREAEAKVEALGAPGSRIQVVDASTLPGVIDNRGVVVKHRAGAPRPGKVARQSSNVEAPEEGLALDQGHGMPEQEPGLAGSSVTGGSKSFKMPAWVTHDDIRGALHLARPDEPGNKKLSKSQAQRKFNEVMSTREGVARFLKSVMEVLYGEGMAEPEAPKKPARRHKSRRH